MSQERKGKSRRLYGAVVLLIGAGIVVSLFSFGLLRQKERARLQSEFAVTAVGHASAIQIAVDDLSDDLYAVKGLFLSSHRVEFSEFKTFAREIAARRPQLLGLEWAPRVADSERDAFEDAEREEGVPEFQITEIAPDGRPAKAARRDEYFPVCCAEPFEMNKAALGLDQNSDPRRRKAMEKARDTGEVAAVEPIRLLRMSSRPEGEVGTLIFLPIYRNGLPHETVAERRENLTGFVISAFEVGVLVEYALRPLGPSGIDVSLFNEGAPESRRLIYFRPSPARSGEVRQVTEPKRSYWLEWRGRFRMTGEFWTVVCRPTPTFFRAHKSLNPWTVFLIGLLFTGLLGGQLFGALSRAAYGERLVAERTARLSEEIAGRLGREKTLQKLTRAVEQTADSVLITDKEGVIEYVNPSFEKLTGYTREEAVGKTPRILKSGVHDPRLYETLWKVILSGNVFHVQFTNRRKDGSFYIEDQTITPLKGDGGNIIHFISSGRDVTERKKLEEQLLQSQKMEAVGRLAGGLAHDYNNLLTQIIGYTELAIGALPADSSIRRDLRDVLQAAERTANLTRQLLAFSRRQVVKLEIIDVNGVIFKMDKMLRRLIGEDVELVVLTAPDLSPIRIDPNQMEQVILNLALNARDAMPNGGRFTVETANVVLEKSHVTAHPEVIPGRYALAAFSDTGVGMSKEVKAHLFEPFFTTKGKGKGTGLGLATCYGIIQQAGGFIDVYSEVGRGTTFRVYLPQVEKEAAPIVKPREAAPLARGSETVLLAEDEPLVRALAARILRAQGYTVIEAATGEEALRLGMQDPLEKIDLLLSDMVMPQMSGKELFAQLSRNRPGVKALFVSGYTENAVISQGEGLLPGASFLQKPFTPEALAHKVREVLDQKTIDGTK